MPIEPQRFPYQPAGSRQEGALPFLPIRLGLDNTWVNTTALLDSGASVNVLPYSMGLQLGAVWHEQGQDLALGGNLASAPAKGILLNAGVGSFENVRLVFAWSQLDNIPTILGQMNFFQTFKITFTGAEQTFDISLYLP